MRAFDLNFTRVMGIFDLNFMRAERKPARLCDKILSRERVLRGDEILNGGGILSSLALNVGKILSDSGILNTAPHDRILNRMPRGKILNRLSCGGTRRGFCRWVLRELCGETSPLLHLRRKFQSAVAAEFVRSKFKGSSRAVQFRKIRAQGQGG